ncbi:glycosyltransferase family 1 protein [Kineosporia sp. J2-2]|uniref:Glycosyltransferase family 1 protein n=1 Tax=Kineosporia corallincola TaxID=2835133 RepID=A0ABS5TRB1_9ACTN|nr:glycosyltransferase [Kineosporia corallincola]MBT0773214.1 glycosyltransferase family 1 protein [Kineosporia corallincola]
MRILISSCPAHGHLLPMLPLARAAQQAGHQVALLSHPSVGGLAPFLPLLPAGPSVPETLAEVMRRSGVDARDVPIDESAENAQQGPIDFFVHARMDLGAEQALAAARDFAPDLVVADIADLYGPYVAAALGVPWAAHGASLPFNEQLARFFEAATIERFARENVHFTGPVAYLDPWPDLLLRPSDVYPAPRIPVRAQPHAGDGPVWQRPAHGERPTVLLTLGTVVEDPQALGGALDSLLELDVDVIVAPHAAGDLGGRTPDPQRVHVAGFVPMKDLLDSGVDVVVTAGGAGTVLSALSAGVPLVLLPLGLDKPMNADRVASVGAGTVVNAPGEIAPAVAEVLAHRHYAEAAARVADSVCSSRPAPAALDLLIETALTTRKSR